MEARAARMGGDGLQCPAQRVSDFLAGRVAGTPGTELQLVESAHEVEAQVFRCYSVTLAP